LDACKGKVEDNPDEGLKRDLDGLEVEFIAACDDAIHEMRNFLQHVSIP
jgi:hypothetical protein